MIFSFNRELHGNVISNFLKHLNKTTTAYILKGGTSLMTCYNLDRFSEDIDLDSLDKKSIFKIVKDFCELNNFQYRIAKDTDTVKRFMINYGIDNKPLKIEISYRSKTIDSTHTKTINGIRVYDIENICIMKASAYGSRDKLRDLYDLTFICNNYWESLSDSTKNLVKQIVAYKGIEQFDYLTQTQTDELIDNDVLAENFMLMFDKLGLLYNEKDFRSENTQNEATISEEQEIPDLPPI